jgi:2-aminoadipate transaminase
VETISFAGGGLHPELLPADELADCAAAVLERDGGRILSYGAGAGYSPLRELLAERFGVPPHRVVLTNGWLQGLGFLAETVRRQSVVVEYPTAGPALRVILGVASNVSYLNLSPEGPSAAELEVYVRTTKTPLAFTIPTFHNPTGQTQGAEQRLALLQVLHRYGTLPLEDDSYGLLRFEGEPVPTLFELSGRWSAYSTSFSYTIAPGLRVGVFVLPDALAGTLAALATSTYITPVLLSQATVFEFIERGSLEAHLERLKVELAGRRDAMLAALERSVRGASWSRPEGGLFVLLSLPPEVNARRALERAEGVTALAGEDFYGRPNTIRLNFAECARDEIEPGIERLAAALADER